MRRIILLFALLISTIASAQQADWLTTDDAYSPFVVTLNEQSRQYRNTGTITLRDPIYHAVLGTYQFVTGGFGRGSAPFGEYEVGSFRDDHGLGPRWELHRPGFHPRPGFSAFDPSIRKMRTWIQLHSLRGAGFTDGTLGCLGVLGGKSVWDQFVRNLNYILGVTGRVRFSVEGNKDALTAVAVVKPIVPRIYHKAVYHKRKHRR